MNLKHGATVLTERTSANPKWRAFTRWCSMRQRCGDKNCQSYPDYGGRGITVCERWADSFENFLADMGEPPQGTTLERINNDGNYEPSNCRWATRAEQVRNRRNNRYLEFNGERMLVPDWARKLGVKPQLLRVRLNRGWSVEETLSRPCDATVGQFK